MSYDSIPQESENIVRERYRVESDLKRDLRDFSNLLLLYRIGRPDVPLQFLTGKLDQMIELDLTEAERSKVDTVEALLKRIFDAHIEDYKVLHKRYSSKDMRQRIYSTMHQKDLEIAMAKTYYRLRDIEQGREENIVSRR